MTTLYTVTFPELDDTDDEAYPNKHVVGAESLWAAAEDALRQHDEDHYHAKRGDLVYVEVTAPDGANYVMHVKCDFKATYSAGGANHV